MELLLTGNLFTGRLPPELPRMLELARLGRNQFVGEGLRDAVVFWEREGTDAVGRISQGCEGFMVSGLRGMTVQHLRCTSRPLRPGMTLGTASALPCNSATRRASLYGLLAGPSRTHSHAVLAPYTHTGGPPPLAPPTRSHPSTTSPPRTCTSCHPQPSLPHPAGPLPPRWSKATRLESIVLQYNAGLRGSVPASWGGQTIWPNLWEL